PEAALAAYDRALAANPQLAQALIGKGNILARLERYDEALACFDEALRISPELDDAQTRRAEVLDRLSRLSRAEAHCFRGSTLLAIDRFAEAVEAYDQAITLSPNYAEAWIGRGHAL